MSMDEVNERFPMIKYKAWMNTRAAEGLSTAGGVASPQSRPVSIYAEPEPSSASPRASEVPSASHNDPDHTSEKSPDPTPSPSTKQCPTPINPLLSPEPTPAPLDGAEIHEMKTNVSTIPGDGHGEGVDDDDQVGPIRMAATADLLASPGDSCAICLETLEDDDDVRGLTCGHAFHAGCLDPWLTSRRACCPLCKADYYVPRPRPAEDPATGTDLAATASNARAVNAGSMIASSSRTRMGVRGSIFHPRNFLPTRFPLRAYSPPASPALSAQPRRLVVMPRRRERQNQVAPARQSEALETTPTNERRSLFSRSRLPRFGARGTVGDVSHVTPSALEAGTTA